MKRLLAVSTLALATAAAAQHADHDHGPKLGKVSFETSCNAAADAAFKRGLGWLHSVENAEAGRTFRRAPRNA